MKKALVILICLLLLFSFGTLVYYALTHSRGIPTQIEKLERVILEAPFIDKEMDLTKGTSLDVWDSISGKEVKLMYQVMVLPWPKVVVPSVSVKAFHNQKDIYFHLSWKDDTEDRDLGMNKFSDACAIMFPLDDKAQPSSIMMGFIGRANIWQWKASQDKEYWLEIHPQTQAHADYYYPFEEDETLIVSKTIPKSAVSDLVAIRVGTVTPKETQSIEGRGFWQDGSWNIIFKRAIKAIDPEIDAVFNPGKPRFCAFAAWNGAKGDRGGRKSISDWVELIIK